jgi:hypothetical protein
MLAQGANNAGGELFHTFSLPSSATCGAGPSPANRSIRQGV